MTNVKFSDTLNDLQREILVERGGNRKHDGMVLGQADAILIFFREFHWEFALITAIKGSTINLWLK